MSGCCAPECGPRASGLGRLAPGAGGGSTWPQRHLGFGTVYRKGPGLGGACGTLAAWRGLEESVKVRAPKGLTAFQVPLFAAISWCWGPGSLASFSFAVILLFGLLILV